MKRLLWLLAILPGLAIGATSVGTANPAPPTAADRSATPPPAVEDAKSGEKQPEVLGRARYNAGVLDVGAGKLDAAADSFLAARDSAGPDPELRYRSAFNLGVVLAQQADQHSKEPERAMDTLRKSAAWFNDAVRLAPEGDDDARVNLEIVMRRIQQLADKLNNGKRLEGRLDRIIDDQRGVRDQIRQLLADVKSEGEASEPLSFQRRFEGLAARERALLAEASAIGELAADERQHIEQQDAKTLSDAQRIRAFQLDSMNRFLQQARQLLSDTRHRLRRLDGEQAHRRGDQALAQLKRAREQLDDPLTVLKAVARDELSLLDHTSALARLSVRRVNAGKSQQADTAPPWLTPAHLVDRQENAAMRTGETVMRLEAGTRDDHAGTGSPQASDHAPSPEAERLRQAAREALPILENARAAMRNAIDLLSQEHMAPAADQEVHALTALNKAIEQFAGLRDLIELAYADQVRLVSWLAPGDAAKDEKPPREKLVEVASSIVDKNLNRMKRLQPLLEEQAAKVVPKKTPSAAAGGAPAGADRSQARAEAERYQLAESLRAKTVAALETLHGSLHSPGVAAAATRKQAAAARDTLEQLRRLFFSLAEHLRELLADQTQTHDDTASTVDTPAGELPAALGAIAERQAAHAKTADAIAGAFARQADAADDKASKGVDLNKVVTEVRAAASNMQAADAEVADAAKRAGTMSPVLEPILDDQRNAMEHLETALRALEPPPNKDQSQQNQQQQQPQQQRQQAQGGADQQQMSQRQALRRLQAIRDRDAARQREREQGTAQREPVEQDW